MMRGAQDCLLVMCQVASVYLAHHPSSCRLLEQGKRLGRPARSIGRSGDEPAAQARSRPHSS